MSIIGCQMSNVEFLAVPQVGIDTFLVVNHLFMGGNIFSDAWEYIVAKRIADVPSAQPHNGTSHKRKDSSENGKNLNYLKTRKPSSKFYHLVSPKRKGSFRVYQNPKKEF